MKSIQYFKKLKKDKNKKFKFIDDFVVRFQMTKNDEKNLKKEIVNLINKNEKNRLFKNYIDCYNYLNSTKFYQVKKDLNIMVSIEKIILKILRKNKMINKFIKGIEFPITLRIAHPKKPKQVTKYQTNLIHCDPWAGEPKDLINIVIYLSVSKNASKLNIYKTDEKLIGINEKNTNYYKSKKFMRTRKYFSYIKNYENASKCKVKHKNGFGYMFNGFVPHNTIREGNKIRISIECRLRTDSPYSNLKLFHKKMNRGGRYWLLPPNKKISNFKNRLVHELKNIRKEKNSKRKIKMRKIDLEKFYNYTQV